ncbi:MAG TPA: type VI secretion system tip protein VgrG [Polyangiaceae bacterium]|nr:type VI secretion system tip protein VgrG [Polyangiaceae bacterium]
MTEATVLHAEVRVDGTDYHVLAMHIRRALDGVDEAVCELTDEAEGPDPATLIGKPVELTLRRQDDSSKTTFTGIVIEARQEAGDSPVPFVTLRCAPRLWRLSQRVDMRVFQNQTVDAIVKDVLVRAGIDEADQDWRLAGSYASRTYVVQHRETDLDFVLRLLSEEGITFAVETSDEGRDVVRFTDTDLGDVLGAADLPYMDEGGFDISRDAVESLHMTSAVATDRVALRDYDFERPDFQLGDDEEAEGPGDKSLETYAFPARTNDEAVAKHFAKVLLASQQCRRERVEGESQALHLSPGRRIAISGHPYEVLNAAYLLLEVEHRYREARWGSSLVGEDAHGCRFVAMPQSIGPYRPARRPRAQAIAGYDSAVVVGPPGSEIHPDEYGRVKAQPLWDRQGDGTDKASCWMRPTQVPLGGGLLTPRVGWEVSLQHEDGDPDRPIVTGRMYTGKAKPPYALPAHKTRSVIQTATSPGGGSVNEMRFDDGEGAEEMFVNASKNMTQSAGNNATETVGGNETRTIGSNQEIDVTGAKSAQAATQIWDVGGNQKVGTATYCVDENGGGQSLSIGGNRDLSIGGDHRRLVGGASTMSVGGIQVDLVAGTVMESTTKPFDESVGAAHVEIAGGGRSVVCGSRVETVGAVKAVLATGGRGVTVGASMTHDVGAAVAIKTKAGLNDNSGGNLTDLALGAQVVKAINVTYTAESLLTVICGGSTLTLTPGSVTLAGAKVDLDGVVPQTAALIKDN